MLLIAEMASCPHIERCKIRQAIGMKAALGVWQSFYCDGGYARCERFKLAGAGLDVPARLLPNGRLLDGQDALIVAAKKGA